MRQKSYSSKLFPNSILKVWCCHLPVETRNNTFLLFIIIKLAGMESLETANNFVLNLHLSSMILCDFFRRNLEKFSNFYFIKQKFIPIIMSESFFGKLRNECYLIFNSFSFLYLSVVFAFLTDTFLFVKFRLLSMRLLRQVSCNNLYLRNNVKLIK